MVRELVLGRCRTNCVTGKALVTEPEERCPFIVDVNVHGHQITVVIKGWPVRSTIGLGVTRDTRKFCHNRRDAMGAMISVHPRLKYRNWVLG